MPQFLIRFQDSTHVVAADDENDLETHILQSIATQTGWSVTHLQCCWLDPPFGTVRVVSSLRGGKGGFGTLLKGQSRQAGAKATTNFGACRDLQGRRLRHVNQAVEQSIWVEWQEKIKAGTATQEDLAKALALNTDSGLVGWHLQLPSWTDVSVSKEQRKWKRKFWRWKREQEAVAAAKQEKRRVQEQQVQSYVQAAQEASSLVQSNLQTALQEGIAQQQKRIKVQPDPPTALLTLAGDVTLAFENDKWQIQSQSNFCTVGIILQQQQQPQKSVYFEIAVVTGGIVQVGWATPRFRPSCESGDGVGDCNQSWAYDGSRQIRLHGGSEESFGKEWKAGDVVGCHLHERKVSYSLNGQDCGVAFTLSQQMGPVFPAISCNPGEIVELHLYPQEQKYQPTGSVAIGDILAQEDVSLPVEGELSDEEIKEDTETKPPAKRAAETPPVQEQQPSKQEPALIVEPLDLDQYESVEELEALGLDRLKGALMAIQVKCGGTLHERAARLFSLKGLAPKDYPPKLRAKRKGSNL